MRTTEQRVTGINSVSISLGVFFYIDYTRQKALVRQYNCLLGRFEIAPAPPGDSFVKNLLKQAAGP